MKPIRIVGISGSPRHANTEIMVREALEGAKINDSVTTEFVSLAGKNILGCTNCRACIKVGHCIVKDDWAELAKPLLDPVPQGVVFGSPVYFFNVTSQARAYMERFTSVMKGSFFPECPTKPPDWSRTAAAGLSVGYDRNGGEEHAISTILHFFMSAGFVTLGSGHVGYIGAPGWLMGTSTPTSVREDLKVGLPAAKIIGRRVAETGLLLALGLDALAKGSSLPQKAGN